LGNSIASLRVIGGLDCGVGHECGLEPVGLVVKKSEGSKREEGRRDPLEREKRKGKTQEEEKTKKKKPSLVAVLVKPAMTRAIQ
jgi:hypothetical protein